MILNSIRCNGVFVLSFLLVSLSLGQTASASNAWPCQPGKSNSPMVSSVLPQFTEINKKVKLLAYNEPSFESIVAEKPDMIASQLEWLIGASSSVGAYEQFAQLIIPVYTHQRTARPMIMQQAVMSGICKNITKRKQPL